MQKSNRGILRVAILLGILILLTLVGLIYFKVKIGNDEIQDSEDIVEFDKHYVLITSNGNDTFWENVYEGAQKEAVENNIFVERMGNNLAVNYATEELIEIAIAAKVDGIILEGDESEVQNEMIIQAAAAGIPVITTLHDNYGSDRNSFVGVSNFDLGREYARQVIKVATTETKSVLIFMDSNSSGSGQNIIYDGYSDTLVNEGNHLNLETSMLAVESEGAFGSQEIIRDVLVNSDEVPDIIICLNERNTISTYQALVDLNMVGEVNIIGYYDSPTILNAIEKRIVFSSIVIDAQEMGSLCVEALEEYGETGYVSDYITMDVKVVNSTNIGEYREDEELEK